ncbi:MAG TPA: FAD-binding oxidoreductase, partial [Verrucomicrobiae bacterium]|nr:FAD-binding oxidoreductase [Verrucomicrobiae bacterium]
MSKHAVEMVIEQATLELPDVKTIRLQWPEGYNPEFKTGQFITLYWPDTPAYKRAYSLSSCALDRGAFEVTIKRDGKMGTRIVDWAKPGDKMFVIPPTGRFLPVFDPPGRHLICIAGGSGVTPFRAFAREAARRQLDTRITILYSVRTTSDIIFAEEFRQLAAQNPKIQFHVTCTRLAPENPWVGRRGRIT